jgi:superfamily II DNA/RNA helicase
MTLDELNSWLLDDAIADDFQAVCKLSATAEFPQLDVSEELEKQSENIDWQRLILAAGFLARGKDRKMQDAALRIATSAVTLKPRTAFSDAAAVLLLQLGNRRAIDLAEGREKVSPDFQSRLGISSLFSTARLTIEDSILLEQPGTWIAANHFQREFWEKINATVGWLSASAPTAAGKTYIVLRWLGEQLASPKINRAVYIAPTRALVSEVEGHLREMVKSYNIENVDISSVPVMPPVDELEKRKLVFVLTQERLHLLANAADLGVDLLLVDEAHKVGDHLRGVILQEAIERTVRASPSARVVFVSPATENPAALLADAPEATATTPVDSDIPTVLQNVILTSQISGKPKQYSFSLNYDDAEHQLGTLTLAHRATGIQKRIAFIAAAIGAEGGTLVYVNGAGTAETVAQLITDHLKSTGQKAIEDQDVDDLCELSRSGVHDKYLLSEFARYGVAFHYGNMPSLLREEIERLFKSGKIQYLVCTSTLIEGVNLSCRNIVIRGPRRGRGNVMEPHDFWNLAGRAGRWGQEFQGNIICIDPKNTNAWPYGIPKRARFPIRPETDEVLDKSEQLLEFLASRKSFDPAELASRAQLEQVGAYLLAIYMREGSVSAAPWAKRFDASLIENLNSVLAGLADGIDVPSEIVDRHVGISAVSMQRLLDRFREQEEQEEKLVPLLPEDDDAWGRLIVIFQRINKHLYPAFVPEVRVRQQALVTINWWKGLSLAKIISAREKYYNDYKIQFRLRDMIRDTMELVEQIARFRGPRYLACYLDILRVHLRAVGKENLLPDDLRIDLFLEFGVSTTTLLSLMSLGVSRMSAVGLSGEMARDDMSAPECVTWVQDNADRLDMLQLPRAVVAEVKRKLLNTSASAP